MKYARLAALLLLTAPGGALLARKHELGFTMGGLPSLERRSSPSRFSTGSGVGLQANYGVRLVEGTQAALYLEVHMLASPLRTVSTTEPAATRDFASLYVIPGLRLRFRPGARAMPWLAAGGGWALYEHSHFNFGGGASAVARHTSKGAFQFGGGMDFPLWRSFRLRAEVRDFYTGSPSYNVSGIRGGQHNIVLGGGFVLHFGE